jgi:site-specific DNA recombinase
MGRLAGYMRVSRVGERAETLISPKLQEREIRGWAKGRGHTLEVLPAELDRSGADDTRPILLGAIERIEHGDLDGVIVWKFDRFTRSLKSSIAFLELIEGAGGRLYSTSEQIDPDSVAGRMTRNILFSVAQGEREHKAEQIEKSKADAIARGVWTAPVVPIGYRKTKERLLVPDPIAAPVVLEAFRRRGAGKSWQDLAAYIRAELDRPFLGASARAMIRRRTYLGEAHQGEHVNLKAHEPIVDRATWEAAQIENPKPPRGVNGPALLIGIIRCAGCQRRMTTTMRKGKRTYGCRRHHAGGACAEPANISGHLVDPFVEEVVLERIEQLSISASERNAAIKEAERKLEGAEAELALYQESVRVADVGPDHFAAGMRTRALAVDDARRDLAAAKLAAPSIPDPRTLGELWPELSVEERRHVLGSTLSVVWVRRGRGSVPARVRLIRTGAGPDGLSIQGKPAGTPVPLGWTEVDFPGEVRPASAEDGEEATTGAIS